MPSKSVVIERTHEGWSHRTLGDRIKGTGCTSAWKAACYKADEAKALAVTAEATLSREELATYKTHVAETFATEAGVKEEMAAVTDVGDRLDKRLDTMTDRLDRVIEHNHKPVRRTT